MEEGGGCKSPVTVKSDVDDLYAKLQKCFIWDIARDATTLNKIMALRVEAVCGSGFIDTSIYKLYAGNGSVRGLVDASKEIVDLECQDIEKRPDIPSKDVQLFEDGLKKSFYKFKVDLSSMLEDNLCAISKEILIEGASMPALANAYERRLDEYLDQFQ